MLDHDLVSKSTGWKILSDVKMLILFDLVLFTDSGLFHIFIWRLSDSQFYFLKQCGLCQTGQLR